jgi:altronate dehydratase
MHPDQLAEKLCVGGVAMIREMLPFIYDVKRETISASVLSLALQCGGSYS